MRQKPRMSLENVSGGVEAVMGWSRSNPSRSSRYAWSLSTVINFYGLDFTDYSLIPFLSFFLHNLWSLCIQCSAVCRIVYCLWVYVIPTCLAFLLSDLCVTTVCLSFLSVSPVCQSCLSVLSVSPVYKSSQSVLSFNPVCQSCLSILSVSTFCQFCLSVYKTHKISKRHF